MKSKGRIGALAVALVVAELLLVLVSWFLSAVQTEGVHTLLSEEGIRWFLGSFTSLLARPLLVWMLLLMSALGCLHQSGLLSFFTFHSSLFTSVRSRFALRITLAFLIIYIIVVLLLIAVPHAVLLSSSGSLFPSPFSRALVPLLAFGIMVAGVIFGLMSDRFHNLADVITSLSYGIQKGAPLFVLYILLVQFYESLRFVFF